MVKLTQKDITGVKTMPLTYRVWVSGQKAETLVIGLFASAIAARLWMAAQYRLKTYDIVAQRWPRD